MSCSLHSTTPLSLLIISIWNVCMKIKPAFSFYKISSFQHNWPFPPWSSFLPWLPLSYIFLVSLLLCGHFQVSFSRSLACTWPFNVGIPRTLPGHLAFQFYTLVIRNAIHSWLQLPLICWWLPPLISSIHHFLSSILYLIAYATSAYFKFNMFKIELIIFFSSNLLIFWGSQTQ